ncbi:MAG: sigma 54-interacting transcriptional regulator [Pyrinomonadaceae bacterium]
MRLLYVEDDPRHADLAVRRLQKTMPHVQVETVSTIRGALARLERMASEPLEMVLTDVHLSDGDGLTLLRRIREHSLPLGVVLLTGMGDEETAVAALKARADDYVVKGQDYLERLPVILESALNHYRADAARRAHPLNILYVEDESSDVDTTRRHFAVHADHLHLEAVFGGPGVLSALRPRAGKPHYDVLLMSFDLGGLNALGVLRELHMVPQPDVPVVLLCREGEEDIARQGLKLGASRYLVKRPGYLYQLPWELEEAHYRADLLRREAALRASEARNRAILNAIPDLMFLQSRDGTYLDYHATDDHLLLLPPEQFLGKNLAEVMPPQLAADFLRCFEQALATDQPVLYEYTLEVPDGVRAFEASIVSCDGDKILSIVRDITERKLAEESLKSALAEVRQLKDRLQEENVYLQEEVRGAGNFDEIIGGSEPLRRVLLQIEKVAPADTTVLLLGETGTGKELFAHAIHNLSPRERHTLVKVNCAALPEHLIESELFGHERGAFTGAVAQRRGRFELADGGTLFLDEVGELPPDLQAKLLRVLEEGEFERVGGSRTLRVNVRLIAATNRRLEESVREGAFRSDLYYRLSVYPVRLPPLRERREDLPVLVSHFVRQFARKMGKEIETIPQDAMAALQSYDWPGNIRELRNVIERAVIITRGPTLRLSDDMGNRMSGEGAPFPGTPSDSEPARFPSAETLEQSEYNLILRTLKRVNWKVEGTGGAAQLLDIHPSTLRTRMKKLGITRSSIQL